MERRITDIPEEYAEWIVAHPDGYYWIDPDTRVEFGPFATVAQAISDMEAGVASEDESGYEPGGTLHEVEAELGIADWIDPETGAPAEGSVPHIEN